VGRGVNVLWRRTARETLGLLALGAGLAGCGEKIPLLRTERRVGLPPGVTVATVAAADSDEIWLGIPGGVVVVDSLGRALTRMEAEGEAPRLLAGGRHRSLVFDGERVLTRLVGDSVAGTRRSRRPEPVAADPLGRWTYTTYAWGSVLGLDSALVTRWGWPDAGARATALAVGALGDRIYLGIAEGRSQPPGVRVLEAWTGREVGAWEMTATPRGLVASGDPRLLYAWDDDGLTGLRHAPGGLLPTWRTSLRGLGMDSIAAVRPSPDGRRLAVVGRRGGAGRLVMLSAATGRDTARWNGTPPDVAWDVRGRLLVPEGRELLWLR
jgi:hypothetical protein